MIVVGIVSNVEGKFDDVVVRVFVAVFDIYVDGSVGDYMGGNDVVGIFSDDEG